MSFVFPYLCYHSSFIQADSPFFFLNNSFTEVLFNTIKFTLLKCMVQRFSLYPLSDAIISILSFWIFSLPWWKKTHTCLAVTLLHPLHPVFHNHLFTFYFYGFIYSEYFIYKWNYLICSLLWLAPLVSIVSVRFIHTFSGSFLFMVE